MTQNVVAAEPCGCTLYDDSELDGNWSIAPCDKHRFGHEWAVEAYFRLKYPEVFGLVRMS